MYVIFDILVYFIMVHYLLMLLLQHLVSLLGPLVLFPCHVVSLRNNSLFSSFLNNQCVISS